MKSRWVLTDEDVRDLLAVTERCDAGDDDIFYPDVLAGLRELIPCDYAAFELLNFGKPGATSAFPEITRWRQIDVGDNGVGRGESDGRPADDDEFGQMWVQEFWKEDGCAGPLLTGDYGTILRYTFTDRERANTPLGSMFVVQGNRHLAEAHMAPYGGTERRLMMWRNEGPDFSERELLMLRLVRPHLAELHAQRDRELRGLPRLTPRQWEILRQVATGATNTQIARTMGVSEGTVRKHLENIFVRLDVLSRTEAVAQARPFLDTARPLLAPVAAAS